MKEFKDKNYKLIMGISVACLVLIIFASSYAYFKTKIINNTNPFSVKVGKVDLLIDTNQITIENAAPILDEDKNEKAITKTFTIKRTTDSNLDICYNLYLVIDQITDNIKNSKYLKYELTDKKSGEVISKNLSTAAYSEGKSTILLKNQYLSDSDTTGVEYELKIWLSYDEVEDQTSLLGGSLTAHLYVSGMQGTVCPASVETLPALKDKLLADNPTISTRSDFSTAFTTNTANTLYKTTEDNIDVYYFAGQDTESTPINNWIKFGGFYWRIIRTNIDGSIRLLYSGTNPDTTSGYIGESAFSAYETASPKYVGYMYGDDDTTLDGIRANTNDSTIKTFIDNWYKNNLTAYTNYLSNDAIYCNDRKLKTGSTYSNSTSSNIDFKLFDRLVINKTPTYDCSNNKDAFSVNNTEANLKYPIALMTADEITYAGGIYNANAPMWYYTNSTYDSITGKKNWWLLSPNYWRQSYAKICSVYGSYNPGFLFNSTITNSDSIRPVVSLKACTLWSQGDGSSSNPYEIVENGGC